VDRPKDLVAAQRRDHPLDLPPVAETSDVAFVTAALGAHCGLVPGIIAEAVHQLRSVGKREASVNEGRIHGAASNRAPIAVSPTNVVNAALTMFIMHAHATPMTDRKPLAGGCFLTIFLLLGFLYGLSIRNPLEGVLIGLGIGVVLAIATWLIDRRRGR
jgi:hypothetical protein